MRAVLLDGSVQDEMGTIRETAGEYLRSQGYQVEVVKLKEMDIADCTGCFACWTRTPGKCIIPDDGIAVAAQFATSELVVLLTPLTFGGYSYHLKKALDRSIGCLLPFLRTFDGEVHHPRRYGHRQRLVAVGLLPARDGEAQQAFYQLVERNSRNLHPVGWATALVFSDESPEMAIIAVKEAFHKAGVGR
jgi:multimeric flavodoxin WrbA